MHWTSFFIGLLAGISVCGVLLAVGEHLLRKAPDYGRVDEWEGE